MKMLAKNLEDTKKIAKDFIFSLSLKENSATVVGLYGDLGAGKTSFVQGVAEALSIDGNIVSPTFVIERIYTIGNSVKVNRFKHLIHLDAYRLEKPEELLRLDWRETISDRNNLVMIEWPERVSEIMPEHIRINFSHISENGREIEIMV